jgi:diadenosine tetraphosphate (Ap4A) HIT family hydrolase
MSANIFESESIFRDAFVAGLEQMLTEHSGLGVFILVMANALIAPEVWEHLDPELHRQFDENANYFTHALTNGELLKASDDDIQVFLKMMVVGYKNLAPSEQHCLGRWSMEFNTLRAFRPPRSANLEISSNHAPFNECGFNFNLGFLRKEALWEGEMEGRYVELLYNKFPFVQNHTLLVPEREHCAPQYLTRGDHSYIWRLSKKLGETLEDVGIAYNSYGAYASVNHLHFQMFIRAERLPIESPIWSHNCGPERYPTEVLAISSMDEAWQEIVKFQQQGISYNLLYRPGHIYIIPRKRQGSEGHANWNSGITWYELCGEFVCFNREAFSTITADDISTEIAKVALS